MTNEKQHQKLQRLLLLTAQSGRLSIPLTTNLITRSNAASSQNIPMTNTDALSLHHAFPLPSLPQLQLSQKRMILLQNTRPISEHTMHSATSLRYAKIQADSLHAIAMLREENSSRSYARFRRLRQSRIHTSTPSRAAV